MQWWKAKQSTYPILAQLARKYLAIPSSSASAERTFSALQRRSDKKRMRTDEQRVGRMVFMNRNLKLYRQLIENDKCAAVSKVRVEELVID